MSESSNVAVKNELTELLSTDFSMGTYLISYLGSEWAPLGPSEPTAAESLLLDLLLRDEPDEKIDFEEDDEDDLESAVEVGLGTGGVLN